VKTCENFNNKYVLNLIKNPNRYFDIFINFIDFYFSYFLEKKDIFQIHSSCISNGKECILIVGDKNSGKSTFGLSLLTNNYKMVSDDQTFLLKKKNKIQALPFYNSMKIKQKNVELIPSFLLSGIGMKRDYFNKIAPELSVIARIKSSYGSIATIVDPVASGFKVEKKVIPVKAIIMMKLTGKIKSKIKLLDNSDDIRKKIFQYFLEKSYYHKDYLINDEMIKKRQMFSDEICSKIPIYQLKFGVDFAKIGNKLKKIVHF